MCTGSAIMKEQVNINKIIMIVQDVLKALDSY